MTWLRIDDAFPEHEKVEHLSHAAFRLHVAALCLCARLLTDGKVTENQVKKVAVGCRIKPAQRYVDELVEARLWSPRVSGWQIKDYLEYNPSADHVKEQRRRAANRQAKWRESHAGSNGVTNDVTNAAPARPGPYPKELLKSVGDANGETPALNKLLEAIGPVDEDALSKLRGYDHRLPEGVIAKVAESVRLGRPRSRVAFALGALRRELGERDNNPRSYLEQKGC